MNNEVTFEETSGNVFDALGFDDPDLELAKALLSGKIAEEIAARGWTRQRAAEVLGIDQPRASEVVNE